MPDVRDQLAERIQCTQFKGGLFDQSLELGVVQAVGPVDAFGHEGAVPLWGLGGASSSKVLHGQGFVEN